MYIHLYRWCVVPERSIWLLFTPSWGLSHLRTWPWAQAVMMQSSSNPSQLIGSSSTILDLWKLGLVFITSTRRIGKLTITGGNSAVRIRDSTWCSIKSSPSKLLEVRLELERSRNVAWLSVRFRGKAAWEEMLPLCRTDTLTC
jgi:hypothetical protein